MEVGELGREEMDVPTVSLQDVPLGQAEEAEDRVLPVSLRRARDGRRYERVSTLLTSNRPVDDWGGLLGDTAAVTAMLDRRLHHARVLNYAPKSWRTKLSTTSPLQEAGANH